MSYRLQRDGLWKIQSLRVKSLAKWYNMIRYDMIWSYHHMNHMSNSKFIQLHLIANRSPIWIFANSMDLARKPLLCKWPQKPTLSIIPSHHTIDTVETWSKIMMIFMTFISSLTFPHCICTFGCSAAAKGGQNLTLPCCSICFKSVYGIRLKGIDRCPTLPGSAHWCISLPSP